MTDTKQTKVDLLAAADLIEKHGWTRGKYARCNGHDISTVAGLMHTKARGETPACFCTLGAINWTVGEDVLRAREAVKALSPLLPERSLVAEWNDNPDRTREEVLGTLRKAAEALP